jgi:predicted ATPase
MTVTIRQLVEEQAAGLIGRRHELDALHELLTGSGRPTISFVHGLAGVGKSTLIQAFAVEARMRCDGDPARLPVELTERGLLGALSDATGADLHGGRCCAPLEASARRSS